MARLLKSRLATPPSPSGVPMPPETDCEQRDSGSLKNRAEGSDRRVGLGAPRGAHLRDTPGAGFFRVVEPEVSGGIGTPMGLPRQSPFTDSDAPRAPAEIR